jgi:hypothetical protein
MFIYVAGIAHNVETSQPVNFDSTLVNHGYTNHGSKLNSFVLSNDFTYKDLPQKNQFLQKAFSAFSKQSTYFQSGSGYDKKILESYLPDKVLGYFQSWRYFELIQNTGYERFKLRQRSDWLEKELALSKLARPIAVHIRRGDYVSLSDQYGLLDGAYFDQAVEVLQKQRGENSSPVWLFSDNPSDCNHILETLAKRWKVRMVLPPKEADAAESMVLISKSQGIVMSNSSFSWWSAALANKDTPVVAPEEWYLNMAQPEEIHNPNWIKVRSTWSHRD